MHGCKRTCAAFIAQSVSERIAYSQDPVPGRAALACLSPDLMAAGDQSGCTLFISAAMPLTCGVAIEFSSRRSLRPLGSAMRPYVGLQENPEEKKATEGAKGVSRTVLLKKIDASNWLCNVDNWLSKMARPVVALNCTVGRGTLQPSHLRAPRRRHRHS
ncbi:hypothetical protein ACMD2_03089 [Ananas comosus]|uniref:Uncharacterized protein n=1 Tax=Ananas comosus TaxID=4615 RepID=A0A199VJ42_ANACO|nr:hypothetical protein ACMD2_03089 [Ananas comosus]